MTAISNSFCKHFRLTSITHSPSLSPLSKVNLQFTPRSRYPQKFSWTRKSNLTNLQLFKSYTVYGKSQQNPEAWQSSKTSLSLILLFIYKSKIQEPQHPDHNNSFRQSKKIKKAQKITHDTYFKLNSSASVSKTSTLAFVVC